MANRLSVIATRTGDDGTTGLGDGSRVGKDTLRVAAMGDVDELNSSLGVALVDLAFDQAVCADIIEIQHRLFDMGAELCIPGHAAVTDANIVWLDQRLAHYNATLAPLREFILPGGSRAAALLHMSRTICRRAERAVVTLGRAEVLNPPVRQYLNRLSDLLFVLARYVNKALDTPDSYWKSPNARPEE